MSELTPDEVAILRQLEGGSVRGNRIRLSDTPARRRLKRLGLICSRPPNAGARRTISGHGYIWNLTPSGWSAFEALPQESK